eukprot:CAMPEP_0194029510 /NCGR_PEP_ID=MMETSP0009_2-20130614/3213_1 /TAXON_ID=210454 /ORGANISM="Grammatophora oceanica, Strain CCMP 410" /LENGTH=576 /DNA_ID=CAMNT_0038669199 /DNA_START=185 /DNA_END=1915 /DNA_ORIENTATION=-
MMQRIVKNAVTNRQRSVRVMRPSRAFLSTTSLKSYSSQSEGDRLLVVGTGVAGSAAALVAAETYGIPTTIICAGRQSTDCNSYWAQGGIIYKGHSQGKDSPSLLSEDIHRAGGEDLCHTPAVVKVATEGPSRVEQLLLDNKEGIFANVPFERDESTGELKLTLEASHSAPRILYYADHTGQKITQHLAEAVARHPLIETLTDTIVTDLVVENDMCVGVETLERGRLVASRGVVLASGGLGGIYQHSTNPPGFNALGSSVALARRAGVATQDLEYVQFHPTALYIPNEARFLLTEALRGEGAVLRNSKGEAFAKNFHPDGELAPRDIVARGVYNEAQATGDQVYLDITHRDAEWLYQRFPTIQSHLKQRGMDLARNALPITPAAHYTCGGISTDLNGATSLRNLYAAGEAARTGLHGGNRLASTSLLEGLVFGATVADYCGTGDGREVAEEAKRVVESSTSLLGRASGARPASPATATQPPATFLLDQVKRTMWDNVGVMRTRSGLEYATDVMEGIRDEASDLYDQEPSRLTAALRDAAYSGHAVAEAAASNPVSGGAHCIVDEEEEEEEVLAAGFQ